MPDRWGRIAGDGDGGGAAQVDAMYSDIEKLYIDLHGNPKLAFHEQRTAAKLAARVKALGYEVTTDVNDTGGRDPQRASAEESLDSFGARPQKYQKLSCWVGQ